MNDLVLVIFGITGDLAVKKLIPALFSLFKNGMLPGKVKIIGLANRHRTRGEMKQIFKKSIISKYGLLKTGVLEKYWSKVSFIFGDFGKPDVYERLRHLIKPKSKSQVIFYLATLPHLHPGIFKSLDKIGLSKNDSVRSKLLVEKPIGLDHPSAKKLNEFLAKYFHEDQIFRIDHYLTKETVQNLLTFRFHNPIVRSMMTDSGIDHVQITASESFGAEMRKTYYDTVGALKDVGQNHVLQMLAIALMDRPAEFNRAGILAERIRTFNSLIAYPESLVLGQYEGYGDNQTNTFFAFKTELNSGPMAGIPIYIRGGKKLSKTIAEISLVFKNDIGAVPNVLIYRIQPNEGIVLEMAMKKPGFEMERHQKTMQFCYSSSDEKLVDAYERLIIDAIKGDQTFFNGAQEVESQWKFIDSLQSENLTPVKYKPGSWGPQEAMDLIEKDGRNWLEPSEDVCRI